MGWTQRLGDSARAALLAISTYFGAEVSDPGLDDPSVEAMRAAMGGQLSPQPTIRTRWYLRDLENAQYQAANGNMQLVGELCTAMDSDGVLRGTLSTRAGGLVRLRKQFSGPSDMTARLEAGSGVEARSEFDEMCPPTELEAFVSDFIKAGVAVGELVPVEGRDYPVFVRRLPQFLVYRWSENRWYFRALSKLIPITPGDGRWVLLTGGREAPWLAGSWRCLGRAYITKDHARSRRDSWEGRLANAAVVTTSPAGATEGQRKNFFRRVADWGLNTVFGLLPGWGVTLLESNGRGHESFLDTIKEQNEEIAKAISGQTVTSDGGIGFVNASIFRSIAADLIQRDGDALAHCLNTQVLPSWTLNRYGEERLAESPRVAWDTTQPDDQKSVADSLSAAAGAIVALREALAPAGLEPDVQSLCTRFGIPTKAAEVSAANEAPKLGVESQSTAVRRLRVAA